MSDRKATCERPSACDLIRETAARHFNVTIADMDGRAKFPDVVLARGVAMYCIRCVTELSLPQIGRQFGKDHTTVLLACRRVEEASLTDGDNAETPAGRGVRAVFDALRDAGLQAVEAG